MGSKKTLKKIPLRQIKIETLVFGRIVNKYRFPLPIIKDFNKAYEKEKKNLVSYGPKLAGRLDTELSIIPVIEKTGAMSYFLTCMNDYLQSLMKYNCLPIKKYHCNILAAWVNDMVAGEYNPPHIHHNGTGYSAVLFLKIPKFINDAKDPHKFKDGNLGFIDVDGIGTTYQEPEIGDFYIFPANHQHVVLPFKTKNKNDIRRSMSFNFIVEEKDVKQLS